MSADSVCQDRLILTCPPSVLDLFAIRRSQTTGALYRHEGPDGPKEGMPLHPEPLRRAQTALILQILKSRKAGSRQPETDDIFRSATSAVKKG